MRKVIQPELHPPPPSEDAGLLLESVALLEVTSEDPAYVAESALAGEGPGWRAAEAGPQKIRLVFAAPLCTCLEGIRSPYSPRRMLMGFTVVARCAGKYSANAEIAIRTSATAA